MSPSYCFTNYFTMCGLIFIFCLFFVIQLFCCWLCFSTFDFSVVISIEQLKSKKKKKNLTTISLHHGIMNSGSKKCFFFIYFLFVANLLAIYLIWTHTIGFSIYSFRCHSLFFFFFIRFEFEEMVYVCRLNFGLATEWLGWEIWDFYFALRNVDRVIAF